MQNSALIEKIQNLPPETASEVEDFVDFLTAKQTKQNHCHVDKSSTESINLRERGVTVAEAAAQRAALASFAEDWERPDMEVYDKL
jgi:hypothetical protein